MHGPPFISCILQTVLWAGSNTYGAHTPWEKCNAADIMEDTGAICDSHATYLPEAGEQIMKTIRYKAHTVWCELRTVHRKCIFACNLFVQINAIIMIKNYFTNSSWVFVHILNTNDLSHLLFCCLVKFRRQNLVILIGFYAIWNFAQGCINRKLLSWKVTSVWIVLHASLQYWNWLMDLFCWQNVAKILWILPHLKYKQ